MGDVIEGEVIVREASAVALRQFYTFSQNNSGGSYDYDFFNGIGPYVVIEAADADDANRKAEAIGLYFDGVGDCECCGSRWYPAWDSEVGTPAPEVYGKTPEAYANDKRRQYEGRCERVVFVHYTTGQITAY